MHANINLQLESLYPYEKYRFLRIIANCNFTNKAIVAAKPTKQEADLLILQTKKKTQE